MYWNGYPKLSRRLARYHPTIALFQSPLSERSVTVSVSLRSPAVNLVARRRQVAFSATKALRISRTAWLPRPDHLCPFALYGAFLHALVRHDPHDYYGHSVSLEVALQRRIPCSVTMRHLERNVGASHITLMRPHWSPSFPRGYPKRLLYSGYRKALAAIVLPEDVCFHPR